jgi:hypothetical protein
MQRTNKLEEMTREWYRISKVERKEKVKKYINW